MHLLGRPCSLIIQTANNIVKENPNSGGIINFLRMTQKMLKLNHFSNVFTKDKFVVKQNS